jgi:hypothetical protein
MLLRSRVSPSAGTPNKLARDDVARVMELENELAASRKELACVKSQVKELTDTVKDLLELKNEVHMLQKQYGEAVNELKAIKARPHVSSQQVAAELEPHFKKYVKDVKAQVESDMTAKMETKMQPIEHKINEAVGLVSKDLTREGDLQEIQLRLTGHDHDLEAVKQRLASVAQDMTVVKGSTASFKDTLLTVKNAPAAPSPPVPVVTSMPMNQCVIKAPRGFIQGHNAAARAKDFNAKVPAHFERQAGHFSLPEATGLVSIGSRQGQGEMWLAFFASASDVSKLFAYKPQLKAKFPEVFVQPSLTKEERAKRKVLWDTAKSFTADQVSKSDNPAQWKFRFVDTLKIEMKGPENETRFVVCDAAGAAKVVPAENGMRDPRAEEKGKGKMRK